MAKDDLELRIKERTAEWTGGIERLQSEIEKRQQTGETLRDCDRLFRQLIESMNEGLAVYDESYQIAYVNEKLCEVSGYDREEIVGYRVMELIQNFDETTLKVLKEQMTRRREGDRGCYELALQAKDGRDLFVRVSSAPIFDEAGEFKGGFAVVTDITERKQAEQSLRESEQRFRAIFERAGMGIVLIDMEGRFVECNPVVQDMFGYSEEELRNRVFWEFIYPDDQSAAIDLYKSAQAGSPFVTPMERRYLRKDGKVVWVRCTASLLRDADNRPQFLLGMLENITQQKHTERALRESEERYRAVVEGQTDLICRFLPDGTLTFVNEAYCHFFGKKREELIGRDFFFLIPDEDHQCVRDQLAALTSSNPVATYEHRVISADGEVRWQQWMDQAICDESGGVIEFQSAGRDITDHKRMAEALQSSERQLRLLSSKLLVAQEEERKRISRELHDSVGQYLNAIKFSVEHIMRAEGNMKKRLTRECESLPPMIRQAIEEVRRICIDLRPSMLDDLGILPTISWFCREFQRIYGTISIETHMAIQEVEVPDRLKIVIFRVVQEALNNVAKHSKANHVRLSLRKTLDTMELIIADNGEGFNMDEACTRHNAKAGLGLTSMQERTELSGGVFVLESSPGKGTVIGAAWRYD